jgi:hypothetical protein
VIITQKFHKVGSGSEVELYSELRDKSGKLLRLYRWCPEISGKWIESTSFGLRKDPVEIDEHDAVNLLIQLERENGEHRNICKGVAHNKLLELLKVHKEANNGGSKNS